MQDSHHIFNKFIKLSSRIALPHYCTDFKNMSYIPKYPIYRVVSVNRGSIDIENIDTKDIVRLISNRKYEPRILLFNNKGNTNSVQMKLLPEFKDVKIENKDFLKINYPKKIITMAKIDDFF
jgi:hypothetical protein